MTRPWTDGLIPPLADSLRGRRWRRVEESRRGGWLVLSAESEGDAVAWFHRPADSDELLQLDPLEDERLPELRREIGIALGDGSSVRLLAWRVGSRAILRLERDDGPRVVKLYRKDRTTELRWSALPPSPDGKWRTPRVLAWDGERRKLVLEWCSGVSLNRLWLTGDGRVEDAASIGSILGWLAATKIPRGLPIHEVAEETRVIEERIPIFERTLANPSPRGRAVAEAVIDRLRGLPEVPAVFSHRDLHDKQLILDGAGGTLIDLDLCAAAHPALDVGNIIAHARLRALKGARLPWRPIVAAVAREAITERDIGDSLGPWTASTLVRLALIYARRERESGLIESLLDSAEQALEGSGEWEGIL